MKHSLRRTSPKGQDFVGICVLCGKGNLPFEGVTQDCENVRGLTQEEAIIEAVLGPDVARAPWPDPTPEMLQSPAFEAVWQCIKRWDINVPSVYAGYCGATGNHVRAILDALAAAR